MRQANALIQAYEQGQRMLIRTKLLLNGFITVACLAGIGGMGLFYIEKVVKEAQILVDQQAIPIVKIDRMNTLAWESWSTLIMHISSTDEVNMDTAQTALEKFDEELNSTHGELLKIYQSLNQVAIENNKTDQGHVDQIQFLLAQWQAFQKDAAEIISLSQDFAKEEAMIVLTERSHKAFTQIHDTMVQLIDHHRANMYKLNETAGTIQRQAMLFLLVLTLVVIGIAGALWYIITKSITAPLETALHTAKQITDGNLTVRAEHYNQSDEIGRLLSGMNAMAASLQGTINESSKVLSKLAAGKLNTTVSDGFKGDFLAIKTALENTMQTLALTTEQNQQQTWLKSGQAQLNDKLSGNQALVQLSKNSIDFIVNYLEMDVGVLYLVNCHDPDNIYLEMQASYGYHHRADAQYKFDIGEGLVGQAYLDKKTIQRDHEPGEYQFIVQSGLSQVVPKHIIFLPFIYENEVKGVVELGHHKPFSHIELEFLQQVMPSLAIAVHTSESRSQTQDLLLESRAQADVLQRQKEFMEESNEKLKNQTEELQAQQEELQAQQEELRQSNEELEQRGQLLTRQRQSVEQKNTELEQAKTAIQIKAEELELASKYKSEFLANMSHELRTPLNSLLILAQLLTSNREGNLNQKQIECAQTIHSAGKDLLNLINEILDLSKVEAGKIEVQLSDMDMQDFSDSLEQKFRHVAEDKGIYFKIKRDENLPERMHTDEQRLQQVINNLLSNAFKFTEKGGIDLTIRRPNTEDNLSASGLTPEQGLVFSVQDSGIGIPEDKQRIIFEAFQQADGTTSRRYGGTGLGLSISKQLSHLLGGELQLHSEEGKGSCFSLFLPEIMVANVSTSESAAPVAHKPSQADLPAPSVSDSTDNENNDDVITLPEPILDEGNAILDDRNNLEAGDQSLLIIEDDKVFAGILLELAREKHFKCLLANNGVTGLDFAEQYQPSAIILDVGLPQIDGWTVMERLKANSKTRHIPVHFMSGTNQVQDAQKMGAIGYALKPVSMADLGVAFHKISRFIEKSIKHLLILADDENHHQAILKAIDNEQIHCELVETPDAALAILKAQEYETIVIDMDVAEQTGIHFLERLSRDEALLEIPIILYSERELTIEENQVLQACGNNMTIKSVYSPERLLDEVSLFLHEVEAKLPEEQQQLLRMVHDKTTILRDKKVLVVDDDSRNIFALTAILESKEMEVLMASNGKEGLETLANIPDIDIVLMDIMMPEMDGYEAIKAIRDIPDNRRLPVIALTAKAMQGDRTKCIEAGANDYLAKPVDTDKLLSLLRVWLYK